MIQEQIVDSLLGLINSISLKELILNGCLDIFSNDKWKEYWKNCNLIIVSIQDRMRMKGYIDFIKNHALNKKTKELVLKREFTLNDVFYLYYYLLKNEVLESLHLIFMDSTANHYNSNRNPSCPINGAPRQSQILVPADRMELVGTLYKPLGLLANNHTLKCKYKP